MKKYLGILLALAMTSCGDTTGGGGNGGSEDTLKEDVTREFVTIQRDRIPYNATDIMDKNAIGSISDSYRIPAVILTKANRLLVTTDARYGGNSDSANNIDSAYRYSDDGGKNWSRVNFFQHFDDFTDGNHSEAGGIKQIHSASFIDPGIVEAPNGDIVSITTVFAWGSGLFNNPSGQIIRNSLNSYTKTGNDTFLRLRHTEKSGSRDSAGTYEYQVKVSGDWAEGELRTVTLTGGNPITESAKQFKVDKYYDVYTMDDKRHMIDQYDLGPINGPLTKSGEKIEANLLYYGSPYHVVTKNYLFMARSTDGGKTFQKSYDIAWQVFADGIANDTKQRFAGVSPGVGFRTGDRILFAIQLVPTTTGGHPVTVGKCQAISMYSDNNGDTWKLGTKAVPITRAGAGLGDLGRFSESQYLATPDPNQLVLMGRISGEMKVAYAVSMDRGDTWSEVTNTGLVNCGKIGSMVGAANLYKSTYGGKPMVVVTHVGNPRGVVDKEDRHHGTMSLGYLVKGGPTGTLTYESKPVYVPTFDGITANKSHVLDQGDARFWTYANNATPSEKFAYSMPIELPNGNIGWFYEGPNYQGGLNVPGSVSWQEVRLDRSGAETTPIFAKP